MDYYFIQFRTRYYLIYHDFIYAEQGDFQSGSILGFPYWTTTSKTILFLKVESIKIKLLSLLSLLKSFENSKSEYGIKNFKTSK